MNHLTIKHIILLVFAFLALSISEASAQKSKKGKKAKKPKTEKTKKEKKAKPASSKSNSAAAATVQLSSMNRDEKNGVAKCPLHSRRMHLSDNFKADASEQSASEDYPFAYQLNYRRYCKACTRKMSKNHKSTDIANNGEGGSTSSPAKAERCEIHSKPLKNNSDFDPNNAEGNPNNVEMPHARQYLFSKYCKICTKVYKIQAKVMK